MVWEGVFCSSLWFMVGFLGVFEEGFVLFV